MHLAVQMVEVGPAIHEVYLASIAVERFSRLVTNLLEADTGVDRRYQLFAVLFKLKRLLPLGTLHLDLLLLLCWSSELASPVLVCFH